VVGLCWNVLCGDVYSVWWVCVGLYCVVLCTVSGGFVMECIVWCCVQCLVGLRWTVLCGDVYSVW